MSTNSQAASHVVERPAVADLARLPLGICGGLLGSLLVALFLMGSLVGPIVVGYLWLSGSEVHPTFAIKGVGAEGQVFFIFAWFSWLADRKMPTTPQAYWVISLFLCALTAMLVRTPIATVHATPHVGDSLVPIVHWLPVVLSFALALWFAISPRNRAYRRVTS